MKANILLGIVMGGLICSLTSQAALVARDLDGNFANGHEGVYDTVLNITWLANANLAATETFGVEGITSEIGPGRMALSVAHEWIVAMNTAGYLGVNAWRLPFATPLDGSQFYNLFSTTNGSSDFGYYLSAPIDPVYNPFGQSSGATNSELAYHYYNNFQAIGGCTGEGTATTFCVDGLTAGISGALDPENNQALFTNLEVIIHLVTDSSTLDSDIAFDFRFGNQFRDDSELRSNYVWAVTDGDVGAQIVPLPAGIWLFLSGLILICVKRRRECDQAC